MENLEDIHSASYDCSMDRSFADLPIESTRSIQTPYGEQDENGTDLSLIRMMLRMTPAERLLMNARAARGALQLVEYGRRSREEPASAAR